MPPTARNATFAIRRARELRSTLAAVVPGDLKVIPHAVIGPVIDTLILTGQATLQTKQVLTEDWEQWLHAAVLPLVTAWSQYIDVSITAERNFLVLRLSPKPLRPMST